MFAAACTPIVGQNTNIQQNSPAQTSPSTQTSPSSETSPTGTPGAGNTETPSSSPSSSPAAAPPPKLIITSLSYHVGEVGIGYAPVTAGASGGTPPYKWSIGGGALPAGLSMSTGGTVSGTPTAAGTGNFVVLLQDSAGQAAGVARSIGVAAHLNAAGICAGGCNVEAGCTNVCGNYATLSGGVAPFKFAVTGGKLPPGMGLNGTGLTGAFPVSLNTSGFVPWQFAVTVTDALGATSSANANYTAFPHLHFFVTAASCGGGPNSPSCALQVFSWNGGTPGSTASVVITNVSATINTLDVKTGGCTVNSATTSPPPGMTTSAGGDFFNLSAGPPPPNFTPWCAYTGTITFILTNTDPCGPSPGMNCSTDNSFTVTFNL